MSVVYPVDDTSSLPPTPPKPSALEFIANHLLLSIGLGLIAAVALGYVLNKIRGGGSSAATNAAPSPTGPGNTVYVPTENTFLNYTAITGSYNDPVTNNIHPPDPDEHDPIDPPFHHGPGPVPIPVPVHTPPPPPAPKPGPQPPPHRTPWSSTYTIKSGDTLSGIAARFHTSWQQLYSKNKNIIDALSREHGNPIPGGPWNNIFPGETIHIP